MWLACLFLVASAVDRIGAVGVVERPIPELRSCVATSSAESSSHVVLALVAFVGQCLHGGQGGNHANAIAVAVNVSVCVILSGGQVNRNALYKRAGIIAKVCWLLMALTSTGFGRKLFR
jgi:hypothetical protein